MATVESVLALRDNITEILLKTSNSVVQVAGDLNRLEKSAVDELITETGIDSLRNAGFAALETAENMARLEPSAINELVTTNEIAAVDDIGAAAAKAAENMARFKDLKINGLIEESDIESIERVDTTAINLVENLNRFNDLKINGLIEDNDVTAIINADAAAVKAAESLNELGNNVVNELITPSAVSSLRTASYAAADIIAAMNKVKETSSVELIGLDNIDRIALMTRQVELLEAKWISQQQVVANLSARFDETVNAQGRASAAAEKLDAELFSAQMQENRLALQAAKALVALEKQEQKSAKVRGGSSLYVDLNNQGISITKLLLVRKCVHTFSHYEHTMRMELEGLD